MASPRHIGRYELYDEIASGGMATVHLGRLIGPVGFSRRVAIKRLHAQFVKDPDFSAMFIDEARLASRIVHPNVVSVLDVVADGGELFLVMEYVEGLSLARLLGRSAERGSPPPLPIVAAIVVGLLEGLHAAHEARDERGEPLHVVHRDVSPQNVLVGADGVARVLDFGIAKAADRLQTTREGTLKGKIAYMAPEQLSADHVDRRSDVYAAGVVLWESLTGQRLFPARTPGAVMHQILSGPLRRPSELSTQVPPELDAVVARALARDPNERFASARAFAQALEASVSTAQPREVGAWVTELLGRDLAVLGERVATLEASRGTAPLPELPEQVPMPAVSDVEAVPARRSSRFAAALVVTLALGTAGAWWLSHTRRSPESEAHLPPAPPIERVPSARPLAAPGPQPPPAISAASVKARPAAVRPATPASRPAPKRDAKSCDPPFFIDGDGLKRYKPECLK